MSIEHQRNDVKRILERNQQMKKDIVGENTDKNFDDEFVSASGCWTPVYMHTEEQSSNTKLDDYLLWEK